ncbi:EAL domain-containing protein [Halomonas sp. YLGW01]|uniref:putative bifunctional diguanylate cyclase/phosphodiesterase n=1 Tax=Halomonas sp. YLGW01 TaxID=2773308 RepID=UPI00177F43F0|nr:EAL domain-containing protein [Halomonas sp. YLGW01]
MRVEIALQASADRDLLVQTLGADESLSPVGLEQGASFSGAADLLILDPTLLQRQRALVSRLRAQAHPVILPVLMLVPGQRVSSDALEQELGQAVEDVLRLPTTAPEIRARVRNLLRLRELSQQQSRAHDVTRQAFDGVSRALKTLNACNEVMLRESDEDGLISAVCRMITQSEGYDLAWVGRLDEGTASLASIAIAAVSGAAAGYTDGLEVRLGDSPWDGAAIGKALSTGRPQVVSDLMADTRMAPWWPQMEAWGLNSVILLPLRTHYGPHTVLAVYSRHRGDFDDEENGLLERLADNLALGVDKVRMWRERELKDREIWRLAYKDSLTALPNRRSLLQCLKRVAAGDGKGRSAAVLFIDLNDFKLINDALGHAAGDEVLKRVARRIQDTLRQGDLVGRQGGDEFIVVMLEEPGQPAPNEDDGVKRLTRGAEALAGRVHRALHKPFDIEGYQHHLGASIGVSLFPYSGDDVELVIEQADMAMYQAKDSGAPLVFYSQDLGSGRQQRLTLEAELYHALAADQFILHYQPIWDIASGSIVGVEALIRWKKADGSMISPGTFIPLAEELGLIGDLGDWVLKTAARQLAAWRREGVEVWMGVNLSVSQLQGKRAAARIHEIITSEETQPGWWSLELTEDTLMRSPEQVAEAMHWLSEEGFRLSLDDFGQGYSSLARLQLMPLDTLKIDKMFVDRLEEEGAGGSIVRAITDLARNLSLATVAEGIETEQQKNQLADIGCQLGQGFWLSAARPGNEIPGLVRQGVPRGDER